MYFKIATIAAAAILLSACEAPTTQRYAISSDNNMVIRTLDVKNVGVGSFQPPASFSDNCRALGPLKVADNLSHTQYIQKAFEDELKVAGAFGATPRVTLSGKVPSSSSIRCAPSPVAPGPLDWTWRLPTARA